VNASSVWVNGNTTDPDNTKYITLASGNWYNAPAAIAYERKGIVHSSSSNNIDSFQYPYIRFKVNLPVTLGTTAPGIRTKTLYVKISAINSANFKITNVKAQLAV
jgi:hypothetical protein